MAGGATFSVFVPAGLLPDEELEAFLSTLDFQGISVRIPLDLDRDNNLIVRSGLGLQDAQNLRKKIAMLGYNVDVRNDSGKDRGDIHTDSTRVFDHEAIHEITSSVIKNAVENPGSWMQLQSFDGNLPEWATKSDVFDGTSVKNIEINETSNTHPVEDEPDVEALPVFDDNSPQSHDAIARKPLSPFANTSLNPDSCQVVTSDTKKSDAKQNSLASILLLSVIILLIAFLIPMFLIYFDFIDCPDFIPMKFRK